MDLSIRSEVEVFEYRHKKFDQRKRSTEEEMSDDHDVEIISMTALAMHAASTPNSVSGRKRKLLEDRADTPYSVSSESSNGCVEFQAIHSVNTSTPLAAKRRKLLPALQLKRQQLKQHSNYSDDSGIVTTPQKSSLLECNNSVTNSPVTSRMRSLAYGSQHDRRMTPVTTVASRVRLQSDSDNNCNSISNSNSNSDNEIDVVSITPPPRESPSSLSLLSPSVVSSSSPTPSSSTPSLSAPFSSVQSPSLSTPSSSLSAAPAVSASTPMSRAVPTATPITVPSHINPEILHKIYQYNGNMVRAFPKKQRTAKEQQRRDKNTIACRVTRRLKKFEQLTLEEDYKSCSAHHLSIVEQTIRSTAYLKQLMRLVAAVDGRVEHMPMSDVASPSVSNNGGSINGGGVGVGICGGDASARNTAGGGGDRACSGSVAAAVAHTLNGQRKPFSIAYLTGA